MGKHAKELGDIVASVYPSYANDGAEEANDCNDDELGKLNHRLNCVLIRFDNDLASTTTLLHCKKATVVD